MEFKIDTKPSYIHITPIANALDANLTESLRQKCEELAAEEKTNFIIDLHNCMKADSMSFSGLADFHESCYNNAQSLVFTEVRENVMAAFKEADVDMILNIAPTMIEAVDIVSMEILERDIFNED